MSYIEFCFETVEDAEFDGWMELEKASANEKGHWIEKCGYRDYLTEII